MSKVNTVPKIWPIQFSGSCVLYVKKRDNFWWFFYYFCPSSILMLKTSKLSQRCEPWIESQKILKMKYFENFGQILANLDENANFLQKSMFKITFCIWTWATHFFLHTFTKFYVYIFILAQVIMQNVILNNLHFCDKNFQKFSSSRFF